MMRYIFLVLFFIPLMLTGQSAADFYHKILAFEEYANTDSAIATVENALISYPGEPRFQKKRIELYLQSGHAGKALSLMEEAGNSLRPDLEWELLEIRCRAALNQKERALTMLRDYLQSKQKISYSRLRTLPEFESLKNEKAWIELFKTDWYTKKQLKAEDAHYLIEHEEYNDALLILDPLIEKQKRKDELRFYRALCYWHTGDYKLALKEVKDALKIGGENADYYSLMASTYQALGKSDKAIDAIQKALLLNPWDPQLLKEAANIYYAAYDNDNSISYLKRYLNAFYNDQEAWFLLANNYFETNQLDQANRIVNQLLEKDQSSADYFFLSGNILFAQSRLGEAIKAYGMALDLNPTDYRIYVNRGQALIDSGNKPDGCRDLKKAFQLNYAPAYELYNNRCEK